MVRPSSFGRGVCILTAALFMMGAPACDDDENACPPAGMSNCDPVEGRCCPEGQGCVLYYGSSGQFVDSCLGGVGEAALGEPCNANASTGELACQPGSTCLRVAGDTEAVCHLLCWSEVDCDGGSCSVDLDGVSVRACQ